jgi:glucan phosphorylase
MAERCLRLAAESPDQELASALGILAADYLSSADAIERPAGQQQQQIQPKEPERTN